MPTPLNFDPGTWNSTTAAPYTLGGIYENGGKLYKYVKLLDAVNATNGMVAEQSTTITDHHVTVDRSGGSSLGRAPVGVFVGAVTATRFGFVQILGIHPAVKDAANAMAALGKFTTHATTDGDAAPTASYTNITAGWALAAASGGSFAAMIEIGA